MWESVSKKVSCRKALPRFRLLLCTTLNAQVYTAHAISRTVEGWTRKRWGLLVPSTAVRSTTPHDNMIPPLHRADCSTHFNHMMWADDLALLATSTHTPTDY